MPKDITLPNQSGRVDPRLGAAGKEAERAQFFDRLGERAKTRIRKRASRQYRRGKTR